MSHIELSKLDTRAPDNVNREEIEAEFEQIREEIVELQQKFYADGRHSLLIVLQGMDASGKDGTVRHVFYGVNPLGIRVYPYGKPTDEEAKHDFLWRLHVNTPKKGMISIFNRSYYEDILVPTVEGYIEKDLIERRYDHINNFEEMLRDNGTIVLKFFLHMSKDMQRERLDERMEERKKNWKHYPNRWQVVQGLSCCQDYSWHTQRSRSSMARTQWCSIKLPKGSFIFWR